MHDIKINMNIIKFLISLKVYLNESAIFSLASSLNYTFTINSSIYITSNLLKYIQSYTVNEKYITFTNIHNCGLPQVNGWKTIKPAGNSPVYSRPIYVKDA